MIRVTYNGADITGSISVNRCWHDMYASGKSDTLQIRLNDEKKIWAKWAPAVGDEIRVDYDTISTGTMFVSQLMPQNGFFDIVANSAPASGFVPQNKAWRQVRLLQIAEEIAKRNGLSFISYGVEDRLYAFIRQENMSDFAFLHRRAQLEGCSFLVYNKALILYSEAYMEAVPPTETISVATDGDFKYTDYRSALYGSCVVESGMYTGEFAADNSVGRIYRPADIGSVGSDQEAQRFAKNLLRSVNKSCCSGYVRSKILPGYAAASTITLSNERASTWDGTIFIDHIRNDYGNGKSKIFFRRPLEGY